MTLIFPTPHAAEHRTDDDPRQVRTAELFARAEHADDTERRRLLTEVIVVNAPVADAVAARYRNRGVDLDDLRQAARLGLVGASHRFRPTEGVDFLSFAVPTMRGEVRRWFRDHGRTVRLPRSMQELKARVRVADAELSSHSYRSPTPVEIADHLGVGADLVTEVLADAPIASLDLDDTGLGGAPTPLRERIGGLDPELAAVETVLDVQRALRVLTERERRILARRVDDGWSQQRIADELGISQMQVSRLIRKILERLRDELALAG